MSATTFRCEICNRFLANVHATITTFGGESCLGKVTGVCKAHGAVEAVGSWRWEDFDSEEAPGKGVGDGAA